MAKRLILAGLMTLLVISVGCRTGDYKYDREIYERMKQILASDPQIKDKIAYNEDGTPMVTFKKGEMYLNVALGLDEGTRQQVVSRALELFHEQYINHPDIKKKDGTYKREKIFIHGFVEDVELYVIEWKLGDPHPNLISDRHGNFI